MAGLYATPHAAHEIVARYRAHAPVPAPDMEIILASQLLVQEGVLVAG